MNWNLKNIAAIVIILLTIAAFWYYLANNPDVVDRLLAIPPLSLVILLALYGVVFVALIFVTRISLRMFGKSMGKGENVLFNAYSSLINFFGPGQSGPAFRAIYLKKRHGLKVKQFIVASLIYYGFYAILSGLLMFVGSAVWWQTLFVVAAIGGISFGVVKWYIAKKADFSGSNGFNPLNILLLFGATVLQVSALTAIYAVELHEAGANASFGQILSYTGVANFSLFVALTPGAIGIREAFLLFSQDLHHISSATIVAASIIDRAVYLLMLGLMFVMVLSMHAKEKLHINQLPIKK